MTSLEEILTELRDCLLKLKDWLFSNNIDAIPPVNEQPEYQQWLDTLPYDF
jgi:hypothetical protein